VLGAVAGTLLKNPQLIKSLYNGLLSPSVGSPAWEAQINAGTNAGVNADLSPVTPVTPPVQFPSGDLYSGADGAADDLSGEITPIDAPSAADVASSIGAPANGDLYAGAVGAADGSTGYGGLLSDASSGLGIATGLASGTPTGDAAAALAAAKLGSSLGVLPTAAGTYATQAAPVLGLYSGIQQGGAAGDAQAAASAAQLASQSGTLGTGASAALGGLGAGLGAFAALYELSLLDSANRPQQQAQLLSKSMANNPYTDPTSPLYSPANAAIYSQYTNAMNQWMAQHNGTLDGFWASQGINPSPPGSGGSTAGRTRSVQS